MKPAPDGDVAPGADARLDQGRAGNHRRCDVGVRRAARASSGYWQHHRARRCLRPLTNFPAAIVAAGGAIRFDEFMRIALYGDHGFYATGGQAGRRGDFITSPEVGPLFGAVLARWIDAEFHRIGEPDDFMIVECGAGPGTLARVGAGSRAAMARSYVAVEVSAMPNGDSIPAGCVRWPTSLR